MKKTFKDLLEIKILFLSGLISALTSITGVLVIPKLITAISSGHQASAYGQLIIALVLIFAGLIIIGSVLLKSINQLLRPQQPKPFSYYSSGLMKLLVTAVIAVLCISFLYGLLAVALNRMLRGSMTSGEIKSVISVVTNILTVLIIPLFISVLLTFTLDGETAERSIITGVKSLTVSYAKLLIPTLIIYLLGNAIFVPLSYVTENILVDILRLLLLIIIGIFSVPLLVAIYECKIVPRKRRSGRKEY